MIPLIESGEHPIIVDSRGQSRFVRQAFVALGDRARLAIRATGEELERRFATFAGVPFQDALDRQQWEQLWEAEPWPSHEREASSGLGSPSVD
jgi:hypothetical protein